MLLRRSYFTVLFVGVFGIIGCTNNDDVGTDNPEEKQPISIMAKLHTPEVPDEKIQRLLEEKTDTKLDIQWVPADNYDERLNAAFATGNLSQVVFVNNTDMFREAIKDDQFWEIGPYLDDYENLKKLKPDIMKNSEVDGKVYSLYQGRPLSRAGLTYRKDWADALGLDAPTNTDEVLEMARAFTEEDPDGNGRNDTIGLTERSDLYFGAFKTVSSWFGTPNGWGMENGEILPEFMFDEYIDTLNFFKELHSNGYINQDFPVASKTDQTNMFVSGKAGMLIGAMGGVEGLYNDAVQLNPDVEFDVHNQIEGPHGEFEIWSLPGYGNLLLFPKSTVETEEDLKHILSFYDQLMDPEIANLIMWGIEDEHYTVTENNMAKVISENQAVFDREVRPYLSLEIGEPETTGRLEVYSDYEPKMKATELKKDNENYLIQDYSIGLNSETYAQSGERLQELINDATYQYILGQIDEEGFTHAVENWKSQGGEEIIAEFTDSYNTLN